MRDLKADLELCNKATPGPWEVFPPLCGPEGQTVYQVDSGGPICDVSDPYPRGDNKPQENMMFIAQAREGWPHAIERAMKAEALARGLVEALRRYEEWEASLLLEDGAWERNAGLPVFAQELYDSWMEIQDVRNEALIKAEEVLGDE